MVGGSNYERNLLALINKLPWRQSVSHQLKDGREASMISHLSKTGGQPWSRSGPIPLGSKECRVGDIDFLFWTRLPDEALLVSLKWFYGPDSIQEVWNHSQEYRKAIRDLNRVSQYLSENSEEVSSRNNLNPPLGSDTKVFPALVSYEDEILYRDRPDDIPCITLAQFVETLEDGPESLHHLYHRLLKISNRRPPLSKTVEWNTLRLGAWRFRLPFFKY